MAPRNTQKRRITELNTGEVSLVDLGANDKKFHILKQKTGNRGMTDFEELPAILKSFELPELKNEEQLEKDIEKANGGKSVSRNAVALIKGAMTLLQKAGEDENFIKGMSVSMFSDDGKKSIFVRKEASKEETITKAAHDDEIAKIKKEATMTPEEKKEVEQGVHSEYSDRIEKALTLIENDEVKVTVKKALNGADIQVVQLDKAALERIEKSEKIAKEAVEKAERLEDENQKRDFIEKAAEMENIGSAKNLGTILHKCSKKLDKEDYEEVERILKAANEQLDSAELFVEKGSETFDDQDAEGQVKTLVIQKRKDDPKLTENQAYREVMKENKELYKELS